jgi:hypothetical protein
MQSPIAVDSIFRLDFAQLFHTPAINDADVTVRHVTPAFLKSAFRLLPVTLDAIPVHGVSFLIDNAMAMTCR